MEFPEFAPSPIVEIAARVERLEKAMALGRTTHLIVRVEDLQGGAHFLRLENIGAIRPVYPAALGETARPLPPPGQPFVDRARLVAFNGTELVVRGSPDEIAARIGWVVPATEKSR